MLPGRPVGVLTGPNLAREILEGRSAATVIAATDPSAASALQGLLASERLRVYTNDDLVGCELGGALKNVIALAAGMAEGLDIGDNARAALITRGLAEIVRLGLAKGGRTETLMGLCGIGDLVLTCNAMQSRNFSLGVALGRGEALADILDARASVAEGVFSAAAVNQLARGLGIDMPICLAVDGILNHFADIDAAIEGLLSRPTDLETDFQG